MISILTIGSLYWSSHQQRDWVQQCTTAHTTLSPSSWSTSRGWRWWWWWPARPRCEPPHSRHQSKVGSQSKPTSQCSPFAAHLITIWCQSWFFTIFDHFWPFSAPNNNGFRIHWNIQTDFILKWQSSWTRRWETMHHQKRITRPLSAYLSSFICYARFMLGNR